MASPEIAEEVAAQVRAAKEELLGMLPSYFDKLVKATADEVVKQMGGGISPEEVAQRAAQIAREQITATVAEARQEMAQATSNGNGQHEASSQPQPQPRATSQSDSPGRRIMSSIMADPITLVEKIFDKLIAYRMASNPIAQTEALFAQWPILRALYTQDDPLLSQRTIADAVGVGLRARQTATGQPAGWPTTRAGTPINPAVKWPTQPAQPAEMRQKKVERITW